ncbi:MAG TPA: hypothetical protein VFS60_08850, partial [Thermoanaerobaculia bacterium]|nr:hypothetical protein [Thermoanaerobaculia bacterium]
MTAALLFVTALLAGVAWARLLPGRTSRPERLAAAGVVGVLAGMWASWLAVLACGLAVGEWLAAAALLAAATVGWRLWRRRARAAARVPRGLRAWWLGTT